MAQVRKFLSLSPPDDWKGKLARLSARLGTESLRKIVECMMECFSVLVTGHFDLSPHTH